MEVEFVVEEAGCPSCADLVGHMVAELGQLREITIDEEADTARVRAMLPAHLGHEEVDAALEQTSAGSGHAYRVRPGSWLALE